MNKTVILVDGQNLAHDLRDIGIQEKDVDWTKLFNDIVGLDNQFVRAYWFRPERISGLITKPEIIEKLIVKRLFNPLYKEYITKGLNALDPKSRKEFEEKCKQVNDWVSEQQRKFEGAEKAFDQLCMKHNNIEIVRSGEVKVDSIEMAYFGEKGVDIAVAVKMIDLSLGGKCDKIILFSGDSDYTTAIRYVKDRLVQLNVVSIPKDAAANSTAKSLRVIADTVIEIPESNFKAKYVIP